MAGVPTQDPSVADDPWRTPIVQPRHPGSSALTFESETPILDETIAVVTEKVWSFRSVLKAAAEALVGYGLSPQVVGYETVPDGDDDNKVAEKDDGEAALRKVVNDEILSRTSSEDVSNRTSSQGRAWEQSRLVSREEYEDDTNHAFVEATRKDANERKSLARRTFSEEDEEEEQTRHI